MAYQICATRVITLLKTKFPTNIWSRENNEQRMDITRTILRDMGSYGLSLDDEIFKKMFTVVYAGLTIDDYIVPLTDIDIDPDLRIYNEYDKDYDECIEEEENNEFEFNIPDPICLEEKQTETDVDTMIVLNGV